MTVSDWGTNPNPLQCKHKVLTTELPGKPFSFYIALSSELGKTELCVCVCVHVCVYMYIFWRAEDKSHCQLYKLYKLYKWGNATEKTEKV